jgi:transcriptional regulator with XRE-family HTH domain
MNPKEIGAFLKQLRNGKGITQEQLAEVLGVSGRTVSRWETGKNLPDLSILIQISEYYQVEMKEILNGERKSGDMDSELKETLLKVADYNELEKQRAAKAGSISFNIMFSSDSHANADNRKLVFGHRRNSYTRYRRDYIHFFFYKKRLLERRDNKKHSPRRLYY